MLIAAGLVILLLIFSQRPLFSPFAFGAKPIVYNQLYSNTPTSEEREN